MDNVTILRVDTGEAVQSVNDLRQNIKTLKDQLGKLEIGSEQYQKTLTELTVNQNALRGAMNGTAASMQDVMRAARAETDANTGLATSYNGLVNQMAALRKEQRSLNISTAEGQAEYERYATEINRVNDRLKELDALNGNHQRNVGNYTSGQKEVVDNFKLLREEIKRYRSELLGLDEGTEEYNLTMQKLADAQFKLRDANETARWSANDLGEQLSTVNRVGNGLLSGFTALQGAVALAGGDAEALEQAFYKAQVAAQVLQGMQGLEGLTKDLPIMVRQFKAATSGVRAFTAGLSGMQKALLATGIGALVAGLALVVTNWEKISQWIGISNKEAESFKGVSARIADEYSRMNDDLDYQLRLRKAQGEEISAVEEAQERLKQLTSQQVDLDSQIARIRNSVAIGIVKEKDVSEELASLEEQRAELNKAQLKAQQDYNIARAQAATDARKEQEEEIARLKRMAELRGQINASSLNVDMPELDDVEAPVADFSGLTENPEADALLIRQQAQLDALEGMTDRRMRLAAIATQDEEANALEQIRIQEEANARKLALLQQFEEQAYSQGDVSAAVQWQQQQADLEIEIAETAYAQEKAIRDKAVQDEVERRQRMSSIMQFSAGAISSILTSVADAYEASAGDSEAAAERVKGIRIAAATIDTISGAIGAYMQASATIPPPAGQIIGAIQAAAVTAAGIAQIAQIKNTDISGGSSSSPSSGSMSAVVPAPTLDTEIPTVRNLTGASEEDRLNRMAEDQRVYILSSDIEASQNSRRVRVRESSF